MIFEDLIEKCRFSTTEKPCHNRDGHSPFRNIKLKSLHIFGSSEFMAVLNSAFG